MHNAVSCKGITFVCVVLLFGFRPLPGKLPKMCVAALMVYRYSKRLSTCNGHLLLRRTRMFSGDMSRHAMHHNYCILEYMHEPSRSSTQTESDIIAFWST